MERRQRTLIRHHTFCRLGEQWYFHHAFEHATAMMNARDNWYAAADKFRVKNMQSCRPQKLKWESLRALLRGQVLLNTLCYTIPDLKAFIKLTNEFKFKPRAFHRTHQTYLVPETPKKAYDSNPQAAALFANNTHSKAEASIASDKAAQIPSDNVITPPHVTDNPYSMPSTSSSRQRRPTAVACPITRPTPAPPGASAELFGLGERIG